ncbi:hypothetical protein [Effusibacillus lacus]|uniref:Phosphoglyceromutase n=1 Tax=Effusibacillus lacus TaxID=1348429 RepID=A0A292YJR5_9BACL|nr:hypothetical protein [Effusibacillus lacus]TCS74818.1 hypothetical protein EDD64_111108 [Effusibacillus lacus]GAX88624.1 hypothetical protein EFBL_0236 [Effusibacillus lacus]
MKLSMKKWALCMAVLLSILLFGTPAFALQPDENQATVVILPGLTWETLSPAITPNLCRMIDTGGAANMVLPFRGGEDSGERAIMTGTGNHISSQTMLEQVTASGGRVASILKQSGGTAVYTEYLAVRDRANLVIVRNAEFTRLAAQRMTMTPEEFRNRYMLALADADRLIGKLLENADYKHLLIVVNPVSFADVGLGVPSAGIVLMNGSDILPNSLLSSNSTRHLGLVTSYDIAPTVLSFLGMKSYIKGGLGQVIGSLPISEPNQVEVMNQIKHLAELNRSRPFMVKGYVGAVIGLLLLTIISRVKGKPKQEWLDRLLPILLAFPAIYLVLPLANASSTQEMIMNLLLITALVWTGLSLIRTVRARLLLISCSSVFLIMFDMLQQGQWAKESWMGYDLLNGARFYGMGNEYMGILIGASLLAYFLLMERYPLRQKLIKTSGLLLFAGIVFLLAAPQFGTNAGGALAAGLVYTYTVLSGMENKSGHFRWIWVLSGVATTLGILLFLNLMISPEEFSHIGRAASLMMQGDMTEVFSMILRKMALNWRLLGVSIWGLMFAAVLGVLLLQLKKPDIIKTAPGQFPGRYTTSFLVGGAAVFLLNDSGVLAAAGLMLHAAVPILAQLPPVESLVTDAAIQDELAGERTS